MRLRANLVSGELIAPLTDSATTIVHPTFEVLPVVAGSDILTLTIDPHGATPEIVHVTAHAADSDTVTVTRGAEGTTAVAHEDEVPWEHAPTAADFQALASYLTADVLGVLDPDTAELALELISGVFGLPPEVIDEVVANLMPVLGFLLQNPDDTETALINASNILAVLLVRIYLQGVQLGGAALRDGGNTFTGLQRIDSTLPDYDITSITGDEELVESLAVRDQDASRLLYMRSGFLTIPGLGRLRLSGLLTPEWDPTVNAGAGGETGNVALLAYGFLGALDDDNQPAFRYAVRTAPGDTLGALSIATLASVAVGAPNADFDAVPRSWLLVQLAAIQDDVDGIQTDLTNLEDDVDGLHDTVDGIDGRVTDLENAPASWQPVIPTLPYGDSVFANDILAGDGIWHIDPTHSKHYLYINSDAVFPSNIITVQVDNPGPGKFVKLALIIDNQSEESPSLAVIDTTAGTPAGQIPAHSARPFATPYALDVFGGDPGFEVLWAYRVS